MLEMHAGMNEIRMTISNCSGVFILVYFSMYLKFLIIKSQNERALQLKRGKN